MVRQTGHVVVPSGCGNIAEFRVESHRTSGTAVDGIGLFKVIKRTQVWRRLIEDSNARLMSRTRSAAMTTVLQLLLSFCTLKNSALVGAF